MSECSDNCWENCFKEANEEVHNIFMNTVNIGEFLTEYVKYARLVSPTNKFVFASITSLCVHYLKYLLTDDDTPSVRYLIANLFYFFCEAGGKAAIPIDNLIVEGIKKAIMELEEESDDVKLRDCCSDQLIQAVARVYNKLGNLLDFIQVYGQKFASMPSLNISVLYGFLICIYLHFFKKESRCKQNAFEFFLINIIVQAVRLQVTFPPPIIQEMLSACNLLHIIKKDYE